MDPSDFPEVSLVLPALNEGRTVGTCIRKAVEAFKKNGIRGEIIVVDSNSSDDTAVTAEREGAILINEPKKGKANAMRTGFEKARGKYIIVSDADDTYDLRELDKFVDALGEGYDFVNGSRFKGGIVKGAMPGLHKYIGNPLLTKTYNLLFARRLSDLTTGYFAFRKEILKDLKIVSTGFEFEAEIKAKVAREGLRMCEVPVKLYSRPEGSVAKLNSLEDGWRLFRFLLIFAPSWLFLGTGIALFLAGMLMAFALLMGPVVIGSITLNLHPMIFGAFLSILGIQIVVLGLQTKLYAFSHGFETQGKTVTFVLRHFNLKRGALLGIAVTATGLLVLVYILAEWLNEGFVPHVKLMITGMSLFVIGLQILFSSWFISTMMIMTRNERVEA